MATCTFDQLLYALRVSVEAANEGLQRRRAMHRQADDSDALRCSDHVVVTHTAVPAFLIIIFWCSIASF